MAQRHRTGVRDELRFHRDRLIEDYVARGMDRQAAERQVFLEFGNVAQLEEDVRDVRGRWVDDFTNDVRYAWRTLRRSPAFAIVAVVSLGLAIGANTAIFSLVNAVLLRPLPVDRPGELVQVTRLSADRHPVHASYPLFNVFHDRMPSLAGTFAMRSMETSAVIDGSDEFVRADAVSGEYFSVLGLTPQAGRLLTASDDADGATPAAVISDRYWTRRFARSPEVIGKRAAMQDRIFTIVGVMPRRFDSATVGNRPDLVVPLLPTLSEDQRTEPTSNFLNVLARLKPGVSVTQADAESSTLFRAFIEPLASQIPVARRGGLLSQRAGAVPAPDGINPFRADLEQPLLLVMAIAGCILLLACVNVSGLLLARASARTREVSIRLAIGAGRGRLIRQFFTESLVLVSLGGLLGIGLASRLAVYLFDIFATGRNLELSIAPDWRVAAFCVAVTLLASVLAGLVPSLHALRSAPLPMLKQVPARGQAWLGKALVVAQFAISMMLAVAAALFVGSLVSLYQVDRGFDSTGLTVVAVRAERPYADNQVNAVTNRIVDALRRMPQVESATAAEVLPVDGNLWVPAIEVQGPSLHPDDSDAAFNVVSTAYFSTMRTRLVAGRDFSDRDTLDASKVAIVNAEFTRYFFGQGSALGRQVKYRDHVYEIVGMVGDTKYEDLRSPSPRTLYVAASQRAADQPADYRYIVRLAGSDARTLGPDLAAALRTADPGLHLRSTIGYADVIGRTLPAERLLATLGGLFAIAAVLVAAIGLFGLLAFQIARRTNELGVRLALGATPAALVRLVCRDVAWLLVAGLAFGAGGALALTGFARSVLFGLTPNDPRAYATAAVVLTAAAILAAWLPALRASRVSPITALRQD
jgi:predicted permease